MDKILEKIKEYETIILHSHIRPDGDAIGSQYGLMYLIKESFPNKKVYVTGESSKYISFLGSPELLDEKSFNNSLSICLDCGSFDRLSDNRISLSSYTIKIDHHFDSEKYCDYEYIDYNASSCTEIITDFYLKFKDVLKMSKEAATALYVGLLTDTGHFKNSNVNSKTFMIASELVSYNVDLNLVNNLLFLENENSLRLKAYCLNNFKITNEGFAYIKLTKEEYKKFNVDEETASSLVTLISSLEESLVWALIIEKESGIRIRLRSRGPEINKLAQKYNGGGHKVASGAELKDWNELDTFINDVNFLLNEYKKNFTEDIYK